MKSKITLFLFFFLISTTLAFGQNFKFKSTDISQIQNVVPDTIYPPASYFPSYASAWTQTTNYPNRINIFKATPLIQGGIVFIGNSITEFGYDWSARFGVNGIQNRGIAGDVTEGVLERLGEIGYFKPKAVFILIGINDIFANKTSDFVAGNILKIVNSIHARTPDTKVYVQTILPNGTVSTRPIIAATNLLLKSSAVANNYTVVDLHPLFADANDNIQAAYTTDGTHLTEAGYSVWIANEKVLINSIFGATQTNLISSCMGNGMTGTNSEQTKWGWAYSGPFTTPVWGQANVTSGLRFRDLTNTAVSIGGNYSGRESLIRWDGYYNTYSSNVGGTFSLGLGNGSTTTASGISLTGGTPYTFSGYAEWINNGNAPTFTVQYSTSQFNAGTSIGTIALTWNGTTSGLKYFPFSFTFTPTTTGNYFLQFTQTGGLSANVGGILGLANLSLVESTNSSVPQNLNIVLLAGQSNMAGRGVYSELSDTTTYSNILSLNRDSVWVRAKHPLHWDKAEAAVGMGIQFAHELALKMGGDVKIGLVPCAAGGTSIDNWLNNDWFAYTGNFNLYNNLIQRARKAAKNGKIVGMIWHQGESDATTLLYPGYQNKLNNLFLKIRADLNLPTMPIVAGELGTYLSNNSSYPRWDSINVAINGLKKTLQYYDVASSNGLVSNSDITHFTSASQLILGTRYADLFYPLLTNATAVQFPDIEPAKIVVNPNSIHISMDSKQIFQIDIFDTLGRNIKKIHCHQNIIDIPIVGMKGLCIVSIKSESGCISRKIVL